MFEINGNVLLLGSKGVGKTTLVTLINNTLKNELDRVTNVKHSIRVPNKKEKRNLEDKYEELQKMFKEPGTVSTGIAGTKIYESYELLIRNDEVKKDICSITFHDYPGGDFSSNTTKEKLLKLFLISDVILFVIDTPYLLEGSIGENEKRNNAKLLLDWIKNNYSRMKCKKIIIVPIKCEKYESYLVRNRIENNLSELIEFVNKLKNIDIEVMDVHTIGGVVFKRFDYSKLEEELPREEFSRKHPTSEMKQYNIDLLTRRIVYNLLGFDEYRGFKGIIYVLFGNKLKTIREKLKKALEKALR